jgi:hypothetical protein
MPTDDNDMKITVTWISPVHRVRVRRVFFTAFFSPNEGYTHGGICCTAHRTHTPPYIYRSRAELNSHKRPATLLELSSTDCAFFHSNWMGAINANCILCQCNSCEFFIRVYSANNRALCERAKLHSRMGASMMYIF